MTKIIALVDDDRNILTSVSIALENEGYKVQTYVDGESAYIGITRTPPDLAIIDIKMPRMNGEELLKKLRKKTNMPIIFLTSKDEEVDELLGLKLGADDYVKKSGGFSINVLIERVKVQFRKKDQVTPDSKNIIKQGKLMLDPEQLECTWNDQNLPDKLTTTEFQIVYELAKIEEEERIREENRRIKEWEDKFDQEQKKKEEELIRKFYSDKTASTNENDSQTDNKDEDKNI